MIDPGDTQDGTQGIGRCEDYDNDQTAVYHATSLPRCMNVAALTLDGRRVCFTHARLIDLTAALRTQDGTEREGGGAMENFGLIASLRAALGRAEAELADARLWGFPDAFDWAEALIEWLGDWHDEEWCDGPQDLIAEVKARLAAAEAVVDAAERHLETMDCAAMLLRIALATYRKTTGSQQEAGE